MDKQKNINEISKNNTSLQLNDVKKDDDLKDQPTSIITKMLNKNLFNYDLDSNNVWARMNYEEIMRD